MISLPHLVAGFKNHTSILWLLLLLLLLCGSHLALLLLQLLLVAIALLLVAIVLLVAVAALIIELHPLLLGDHITTLLSLGDGHDVLVNPGIGSSHMVGLVGVELVVVALPIAIATLDVLVPGDVATT